MRVRVRRSYYTKNIRQANEIKTFRLSHTSSELNPTKKKFIVRKQMTESVQFSENIE